MQWLSWKKYRLWVFFYKYVPAKREKKKQKNIVLILSTNTYTPVTSRQRARSGDDFSTI